MPPENPYAAPQASLVLTDTPEQDEEPSLSEPERHALFEGTRFCLLAVWFALGSVGVFTIGRGLRLGLLANVWILCLLVTAGGFHYRGLYKLIGVYQASRSPGLIRLSLITFVLVMLTYLIEFFATWNREVSMGTLGSLARMVLWLFTTISVTRGLLWIASWHRHELAAWTSKAAFLGFVVCFGILVFYYLARLMPPVDAWLSTWPEQDLRLVAIVFGVFWVGILSFSIVNYARTLWNLRKMAEETTIVN